MSTRSKCYKYYQNKYDIPQVMIITIITTQLKYANHIIYMKYGISTGQCSGCVR